MTETAPGAITRDELADALAALKITPEDENTFYPAVAEAIFAHIARNREPEYVPGRAYEAADGSHLIRSQIGDWVDGSGTRHSHAGPYRPLRRLVPEAPWDAAALVAEWRRLGEEPAQTEFQSAYRAGLRKCADELGYALKGDGEE